MSPIIPLLYIDDKGQFRLYLSGYKPVQFNAETDHRYRQGKDLPNDMKKIGNPEAKLTADEAIDGLLAATKYYKHNKK